MLFAQLLISVPRVLNLLEPQTAPELTLKLSDSDHLVLGSFAS
jgi:hypothetical protein